MEKPESKGEKPTSDASRGGGKAGDRDDAGRAGERAQPPGTDPGDTEANPAASLSLREQLEAARAERDSNRDLYLRTEAELQNFRRRVQKEIEEARQYQSLPLALDLLPALDNLDRAIAVAESSNNIDELVRGVRLVAKQILDALSRHHVVPIDAVGKPFDPNVHQAIQQVATDDYPPMTVVKVVERGFTLRDRVVRPATVIVSKAAEGVPPQSARVPDQLESSSD